MNSEFHYYTTWFLAVKAGFSDPEAARLSWACQYTDHHNRAVVIRHPRGVLESRPSQNYSFWEDSVIQEAYLPFHFFPSWEPMSSVRIDGLVSPRDVRPNSPGVKALLVAALRTRNLERIGIALHTFADSWAHQNFTAWAEDFNRLPTGARVDPSQGLPAPGHSQAGWQPDEWLTEWTDSRLNESRIVNRVRYLDCAGKIYRYLCVFRGREFADQSAVLAELETYILAGRGRDTTAERMLDLVIACSMEPYDRDGPVGRAVELPVEDESPLPALDHIRHLGRELWNRTGLAAPRELTAKPGFEDSAYASWLRAADEHRSLALGLVRENSGSIL
ncbi:MAG: DUF6765 family protein [Spirochaetales bacterium]